MDPKYNDNDVAFFTVKTSPNDATSTDRGFPPDPPPAEDHVVPPAIVDGWSQRVVGDDGHDLPWKQERLRKLTDKRRAAKRTARKSKRRNRR